MAQYAHATTNSSRESASGQASASSVFEANLWKLVLLSGLAYLVWGDKLSVDFHLGDAMSEATESPEGGKAVRASMLDAPGAKKTQKAVGVELPTGPLTNTTLCIDPNFARRNAVPKPEAEASAAAAAAYIKRFSPVAVAEMHKYGIPASITLAQGLLESDAGASQLVRSANNHFGVKCFSKNCGKGHCVNFTDDSHKDFFVKYPNSWGSFRAHSEFLKNTPRYAALFKLTKNDYRAWAAGLARAGYATDKRYAEKLVAIIHNMELARFDAM